MLEEESAGADFFETDIYLEEKCKAGAIESEKRRVASTGLLYGVWAYA